MYTPVRYRTKRDWRKTAVWIHTAAVAATCCIVIYRLVTVGGYEPLGLWLPFFFLDFPSGLLVLLFVSACEYFDLPFHITCVLTPLIGFAALGGMQWYFIVGWLTQKPGSDEDEASLLPSCSVCDYDLRGSLEAGRCPECGEPFDVNRVQRALRELYTL